MKTNPSLGLVAAVQHRRHFPALHCAALLAGLSLFAPPAGAQTPAGMSRITSGGKSFHMGSAVDGGTGAYTVHVVQFTKDFYLGQTEVTYAEYKEVYDWALTHGYTDLYAGQIGTDAVQTGYPGRPDTTANRQHPVTNAKFWDVLKWCNAKSEREGRRPCFYLDPGFVTVMRTGTLPTANGAPTPVFCDWGANGYRLPTSAEWEYAARGGVDDGRRFPWGDTITQQQANYLSGSPPEAYDLNPTRGLHPLYSGTSPVGAFPATGFGLYDMAGNLSEWTWDNSGTNYSTLPPVSIDPRGPDLWTRFKICRSGWFYASAAYAKCAANDVENVDNDYPDYRLGTYGSTIGFRYAITVPLSAAAITGQPNLQVGYAGGTATFAVAVAGAPEPTCLWQRKPAGASAFANLSEGNGFAGVASTTLTVAVSTVAQHGDQFRCIATNSGGSATSDAAELSVYPQPPPWALRLINISTRSLVGTGGDVQIAGFVITGSVAKKVVIRASGPALTGFGVAGALADPVLTLQQGQTVLYQNDDWAADMAPDFSAVGAFAWTVGSKDAALVVRLPPGMYTAQVSGKSGGTGVALIEVYEADGPSPANKLINISTRSLVGTGGDVQFAGFVITGPNPKRVLIRASGPALADYGVAGVLADPMLTINSGQTVLYQNDDWAAGLAPEFAKVGAFPWTPGSKDAALLVTLPPGQYTAKVSGKNDGTGVALIEVYEDD